VFLLLLLLDLALALRFVGSSSSSSQRSTHHTSVSWTLSPTGKWHSAQRLARLVFSLIACLPWGRRSVVSSPSPPTYGGEGRGEEDRTRSIVSNSLAETKSSSSSRAGVDSATPPFMAIHGGVARSRPLHQPSFPNSTGIWKRGSRLEGGSPRQLITSGSVLHIHHFFPSTAAH